jgi:hypothetical protein
MLQTGKPVTYVSPGGGGVWRLTFVPGSAPARAPARAVRIRAMLACIMAGGRFPFVD